LAAMGRLIEGEHGKEGYSSMGQQEMKLDAKMLGEDTIPAGMDFMMDSSGYFCQQRLEIFEAVTGIETPNRYNITPIPRDTSDPVPPDWLQYFKDGAASNPVLKAKEHSACLERVCCAAYRSFDMPFNWTSTDAGAFSLQRPFHCTLICPGICMCGGAQEIFVKDADGRVVAHAQEEFRCGNFCSRSFNAMDGDGQVLYKLKASSCGHANGNNCCAPSCFNRAYGVDVYNPEETKVVSSSQWVWPGCNCGGLTDRSNIVARFPEDATAQQRAAIMGGLFLIEFAVMEWKRLQERNNSKHDN